MRALLHADPPGRLSNLGVLLGGPFRFGMGGPGGWVTLDEPELHFGARPDIMVPDLAGWRRARMPDAAGDETSPAYYDTAPDGVCELISPGIEAVDRGARMPVYAREGVGHAWLVDAAEKSVEVFRPEHGAWRLVATHRGDERVRAEPFDAIELDLGRVWAG